jgi:hypothetical protein
MQNVQHRGIYTASITDMYRVFCKASIKSRLNLGDAPYHLVQSLLSSRLLSSNGKVKMYKTTVLPFVLYECET